MRNFLIAVLALFCFSGVAQPPVIRNRWTTNADNATIDGSNVTNTSPKTNITIINANLLNLSNALNAASGGTGQSNWYNNSIPVMRGTNAAQIVQFGANLALSGADGDTNRILSAVLVPVFTIENSVVITNNTLTPIWTNGLPTNGQYHADFNVTLTGKTNKGSFSYCSINASGTPGPTVTILQTNTLISTYSVPVFTNMVWTISGSNLVLNVTGMTNEAIIAHVQGNWRFDTNGTLPPVLACTTFLNNLVGCVDNLQTSGIGSTGYLSQQLVFGSSATVCSVSATFYQGADANPWTVEWWTGPNRTGSQVGTTSQSANVGDNNCGTGATFTWTSNPVLAAGTYYLTFVTADTFALNINCGDSPGPFSTLAYIGTSPQASKYLAISVSTLQ